MVLIKLQLNDDKTVEQIDSYSMGHITIEGKKGVISSRTAKIDQSMIFLIVTLLF